jgi:hypothetical protein
VNRASQVDARVFELPLQIGHDVPGLADASLVARQAAAQHTRELFDEVEHR